MRTDRGLSKLLVDKPKVELKVSSTKIKNLPLLFFFHFSILYTHLLTKKCRKRSQLSEENKIISNFSLFNSIQLIHQNTDQPSQGSVVLCTNLVMYLPKIFWSCHHDPVFGLKPKAFVYSGIMCLCTHRIKPAHHPVLHYTDHRVMSRQFCHLPTTKRLTTLIQFHARFFEIFSLLPF